MATAKASELPVLIVNGADSPRSRIGRGLESIGGMTAETLQRLSTAVGGVVKSPVVLMAKVGGLASPRAAALPAPPGSSLAERVYHLENQMKSLEEKFSPVTVVTELDLSSPSHKEKPRIAKSLLPEMETGRTLEQRVKMLEDRVNERMDRFEKALASIQSRLDQVEFSWRENLAGDERQESVSGEPQYYDAEQQSDNFEALEAAEQNSYGAHYVPGEATGSSPTLKKLRVKETSSAAPTTAELEEPLQEIDAGKDDDFLNPQVVSTPVYSKEAFSTQPLKSAAPSSEPAESVQRDDAGNLPASSDRQLASTLKELHGSFVTQRSAAAASAKFLEIARAVTAEKSTLAHAASEPQSASELEEPREAFPEEPLAAVPVGKSEEYAQEDAADKSDTAIAAAESLSPPTFEATQNDFTKEPQAAALNGKLAQELATQGFVVIALPSSEPPETSQSVEEPSVAVPNANSEEPAQVDTGDKSVTVTAAGESPKAFAFQDPQEDFKESLAGAPGDGLEHNPSSQEDSSATSEMALASSESPAASKSVEEPSAAAPGAVFEEPEQEDAAHKNGSTIAAAEIPLAASLEEPQEESAKEFTAAAPSTESAQVQATQEDKDVQVAAPESQMASKFVEEPSAAAPSADSEEPAQEDVADKTMAATESSLASSLEEPKKGFEKESMASTPSDEPAEEHSDMAAASSETEGASKFVEEASAAAPSASFGEREHKADADESGTISAGAESPSASSFEDPQEGFEKESVASAPSSEPAQEHSDMAPASSETEGASKFVEASATAPSANFGEREHKADADESGTISAGAKSPSASSFDDPQEDFEESSAAAPSAEPAQELATQEDSSRVLEAPESTVKSKFVEDPSTAVASAGIEEPAREDADKGVTMTAAAESPLPTSHETSHQGPEEDFEKESLVAAPSAGPIHEPSSQEDSVATSDKALASSEPQVASKFAEEPSSDIPSANSEEPAQEDGAIKSDTVIADVKPPVASSFEGPQEDSEKESIAAAPSAEPAQELATQEESDMAPTSSESKGASKFVEELSAAVPSPGFEEPAHEDASDKSVTMPAAAEDPQEDFVKESLAAPPSAGPAHEISSQEDSGATSDKALASSEPQVASKFVEEPSSDIPNASSEEPAQEDGAIKSDTVIADVKPPSASSFEGPQEDSEKESMAALPGTEPAQELATQEASDLAPASSESKGASKFVEEPSAAVPSPGFEDPAGKSVAAREDPQEDFAKESLAAPPNAEPAHEISSQEDLDATRDMTYASSAPHLASKFVEKPSPATPKANSEEPAQDEDVVKSDTVSAGADSPLTSSFEEPQEDFEESLAATSSREPAQGLATEEDTPASSESQEPSKSVDEPSAAVPSADFEEPAHEDAVGKSVAVTAAGVLPFASSFEGPQEDPERESIAAAPSAEPAQELARQEDSDMAPSEPQVTSKFAEEPSATDAPSAKLEEPAHEDTVDRSGSVTAAVESPSVSSLEKHREDYTKESLAAEASAKVLEPTEEDESGESPIAFAPLEAPSPSFLGVPKGPLGTSVQPEEPAEEKSGIVLPGAKSTLSSTVEEGNHAAKETEYKSVEDFNVHHEHVKSSEKEFPRSQSNLAHVDSDESLVAEDCDDRLESDQSGEEFFDAEHGSGNFESWESDEPKSFEKFGVDSDEPGEATGINAAAQKETLAPASILKPAQEPEQAPVREPAQEPEQATARELVQEPEQTPVRELEQEPDEAPARELEQGHESTEQAHAQEHEQHPEQEPEQRPAQEHGQQSAREHGQETGQQHGEATAQAPGQEHEQEIAQELGDKPEQQSEIQPAQELEQEDLTRNSAMALPPSEPQVTSKSGESQELLAEKPLAAVPSTKFEEPAQADAADESGTRDLPLTSIVEETQIDTVVSPEKSLSSASFHQSGNPEILENLNQKSSDTSDASSTPQEALEREPLTAAPTTEIAQEHDAGKSDNVHTSLEPQLEKSKEALENEPVKAVPSSKSTEPAQEVGDGQSGAILASSEPQSTPTSEEPREDFVKEPLADAESASKSVDLEESLADEPSAVPTSAKLAPESVVDKINAGIVEESTLTPIAEEPQSGSTSSLGEGKHGLDEADQKYLEDVKIIAEPVEEAIPRTHSDLTHVKLNPESAEDSTALQSQGSFLGFGSTSVASEEGLVKEPLPSSKLLELFEEENNSGKRGPVLADSPMTSTAEEPQKPPLVAVPEPTLASAKSVPKGHGRWRGFARSSSEPQFAYKLEEHRKALAKESSVAAALPSASKLGEEHAQEDFGDTQCLPFKILGEGKPPRKESESKLVEDVKSPASKSETAPSPYVLEPKPSKIKEKKKERKEKKEEKREKKEEKKERKEEKKEKKERKPDAAAERRLSLGAGEIERKSSLRAEEKGSKYSPRAEEKHKQPFRHLRDRLRHAFSVNKEP